jgi:uncharacterized C2H2 Zn-finger protein
MNTTLTIEQQALAACREFVRASARALKLTRDLGAELLRCPNGGATMRCDCPHCKQVAKLVKERQQVTQRLSVAKRHIDRVGRAAA